MFHIALYQPVIPPNTGNIGRLCVGMNAMLHLIGPCAFDLSSKAVRRAGLDYWPHLKWQLYETPEEFLDWLGDKKAWVVTKFGKTRFDEAEYQSDDVLIFGSEDKGLPKEWHDRFEQTSIYLPMNPSLRSYNLANTASIVLATAKLKTNEMETLEHYNNH